MARLFTAAKAALAWAAIGALGLIWLGSAACPQDDLMCVITWSPR